MKKIATYPTIEQAHLCRVRLGNAGIEAEVFDDTASNLAMATTVGGIRVMVADEDVEAAKKLLEEESSD